MRRLANFEHAIRLAGASVLVLLACLAIASTGQDSGPANRGKSLGDTQPIYITVRIRPDVKAQTLRYLFQVTEPKKAKIKSSADLRTILKRFYISTIRVLREIGKNILKNWQAESHTTREIVFPDGVMGAVNVEINPRSGMTLRDLALTEMGSDDEKTRKAIEDANPSLRGTWDQPITQEVRFPYRIYYSSHILRSRYKGDCATIRRNLNEIDPAVVSAECGPGFGVVPHWTLAATPQQVCPATDGRTRWPFETLPKDWFQLNPDGKIRTALVGVIDTGIPQDDPRFELWQNPAPAQPRTIDRTMTPCTDDFHGCNFVNHGLFPVDDCQAPDAYNHGTHIAGLASGRLWETPEEINRRVQLMILKVADRNGQIEPGRICNAIIYARSNDAAVVNMSLTGTPDSNIRATIRDSAEVLFIAAAGNPSIGVGIDLDDPRHTSLNTGFPAILGRDDQNVISVAAHDGDGQLLCFSNYGKDSVNLAAPGYKLNSTVSAGQTRELNGTSQATALVTFTAALLHARGLTRPSAIKHRIIAATDFDRNLRDKVFSSGKLNIAKALDYRRDLIQYRNGNRKIIPGEILSPLSIPVIGQTNDLKLRGEVYKIVLNYSTEPGKKIQVTALRDGKLVHFYCDTIGKLAFKSSQGPVQISQEEVAEIIPRQGGTGP